MAQNYIRIGELASTPNKVGLLPASPATIWRKVKDGTFPRPVKLAERITAWRMDDIQDWLTSRHEAVGK